MSDENGSYTEVTSTSWFSRLGDSFRGIGIGIILIIAATALLWWNEGRTVRTGDAIAEAQMTTEPMPGIDKIDSAFEGKLVYAGGRAVTNDELVDPVFGIKVNATMQPVDKFGTAIPGVFAAGDCTGEPLQVSKAVGEGLVAALSAAEYLDQLSKE